MQFFKKANVFLSWPAVCRDYGHVRPLQSIEHRLYRHVIQPFSGDPTVVAEGVGMSYSISDTSQSPHQIEGKLGLPPASQLEGQPELHSSVQSEIQSGVQSRVQSRQAGEATHTECPEQASLQLRLEPCEYAAELFASLGRREYAEELQPEYLVCCYDSYPLTDKINAALYMQKLLHLNESLTFSIADVGSLSPVMAIHWAASTHAVVWMVCMEQLGLHELEYVPSGEFPMADAIAACRISPEQGDWRVVGYACMQPDQTEPRVSGSVLGRRTVDFVLDVLHRLDIPVEECALLTQAVSEQYVCELEANMDYVITGIEEVNLGTAGSLYALDTLRSAATTLRYAVLHMADPARGLGCIVLEMTAD